MADWLAAEGVVIDALFTSSVLRAQQTADFFAQSLVDTAGRAGFVYLRCR